MLAGTTGGRCATHLAGTDRPVRLRANGDESMAALGRVWRRSVSTAIAGILTIGGAAAQDTHDVQTWVPVQVQATLRDPWLAQLELQGRAIRDAARLGRLVLRPALGIQLSKNLSVWGGAAWIGLRDPVHATEVRSWQQLLAVHRTSGWTVTDRFRLEQRWLPGVVGVSNRLRLSVKATHPIGRTSWNASLFEEVFIGLNRPRLGPPRGFDRNRVGAGLSKAVSHALTVDLGYLLEVVPRSEPLPVKQNHALLAGITVRLGPS